MNDIEIARQATLLHINEIAEKIGIPQDALIHYGKDKAKLELSYINSLSEKKDGALVLVTAISPTPAGEGKTTTTVGLNDGLNAIGKKAMCCLREPSLGPCFGIKGGAAGGGYAQVVPMEDINLHFTGDLHAIGVAHNLLSAMLENSLYWKNPLGINPRTIEWKRVIDMNDRSLRQIISSLGQGNGDTRETGFDISVTSEVMAALCLSTSLEDLEERLGNISLGVTQDKKRIYARDLLAQGAMTALLKDAFLPNLVQTIENNPAMIHGGPFANIAHGCNSVIATKTALKLADIVVTEAGFGADLGAEKFFDIKCASANLKPQAVVLVATVRAIKMHGGVKKDALGEKNVDAVRAGLSNIYRHIENLQKYNVPVVVAINHFSGDHPEETQALQEGIQSKFPDVSPILCKHWAEGSKGTEDLAKKVVELIESGVANFSPLYNTDNTSDNSLLEHIEKICTEIYHAKGVSMSVKVKKKLAAYQAEGFGNFKICMAKTQYSFSTDPTLLGAPSDHTVEIKDVIINTGAKFLIVITGDIMRMPGLPRVPSATNITVQDGLIHGLS